MTKFDNIVGENGDEGNKSAPTCLYIIALRVNIGYTMMIMVLIRARSVHPSARLNCGSDCEVRIIVSVIMVKQDISWKIFALYVKRGKIICIPSSSFVHIFADLQYLHPGLYIFADLKYLQYLHRGLYMFALRVNTRLSDNLAFGFLQQKIKNGDDCCVDDNNYINNNDMKTNLHFCK